MKKIYEEKITNGELEKRIKNVRHGVLTNQEVICKVMEYITELSFADFMFFKREAYQNVIDRMGGPRKMGTYPDLTVGEVCEFVSEQFHRDPFSKRTGMIIDDMRVPYDIVDLRLEGKPVRVYKNDTTTWDCLEEKEAYSELEAEKPLPLEKRMNRIYNLKRFKKKKFEYNAWNGILPCEYGDYWQQFVAGASLWDINEALETITGKKITCIRKLCDDFTNPDEVNMDFSISEFCDYFIRDMNYQDKLWLFIEPFAEIYRTTKADKCCGS